MTLSRGGRRGRAGPADGAPAAAHPGGARLRPVRDGAFALTPKVLTLGMAYVGALGLWDIARPHLEALVARTGESSSMAQLDGSDIVYVARVSVPKIIALRVEIGTRFPAVADLAGQGAARRPVPRRARRHPRRAQPRRAAAVHRPLARRAAARRADRGARPRLGAGRRGAGARRPLGRRPGAGRDRHGAGRHERHRARRGDHAPSGCSRDHLPAAAAHRRRRQRRVGAVAVPAARRAAADLRRRARPTA